MPTLQRTHRSVTKTITAAIRKMSATSRHPL